MPIETNLPVYTPEEQASRAYGFGLQDLLLSPFAQLTPPDPNQPLWKEINPIKPMIGNLYNALTGIPELGMNYVGKPAAQFLQNLSPAFKSVTPTIPDTYVQFPGREAATQASEAGVQGARTNLRPFTPVTEEDKRGADIGMSMGLGATTLGIPGVLPATPAMAAIGAATGGGVAPIAPPAGHDPNEIKPIAPVSVLDQAAPEIKPIATIVGNSIQPILTPSDPGWSYGAYAAGLAAAGVATWVAAKHGPMVLNTISDILRGQSRDPIAVTQALDSGIPLNRNVPTPEMPLPNDAGGLTRRMAANAYNPNAVPNELAKGLYPNDPAAQQAMIAVNEAVNNPANSSRRMESLFRTGVEQGTGHSLPKIIDYKRSTDAMTDGQREMANFAAWYKSELNVRNQNIQEAAKNGILPTPANDAQFRVSYPDMSTDDLRHAVNLAESDPVVKAWLDQNRAIQMAIVDSAEKRGFITPAQANHARTAYPDFMPTFGANGEYLHSWDGKIGEATTGYARPPAKAWEAMINHFDRSIRSAQRNDWLRSHLFAVEKEQTARPELGKIVERVTSPDPNAPAPHIMPGSAVRKSITVQTSEGPVTFDMNNTAHWRALTTSPQHMGVTSQIANGIRMFYQNATTGPLAMLAGHPFAVKNAIRDTMLIPAQAGEGAYRGMLDKALGARLPYDPTFPVGVAKTMVGDTSTVVARSLSDILGNRNHPLAAALRKTLGDDKVDFLVDWMRARIANTNLAEREALGVGGGGNRSTVDMNNLVSDRSGTYRDPTSHAVSPVLDLNVIPTKVPLPNIVRQTVNGVARGAAESYFNLQALAKDIYGVISDAPHSYYFDVNKGNPKFTPQTLANEVQQVTGNPGTQGMGTITRGLSRSLPYYNTSIQGMGRSLAAFRDRPIATGITAATVLLPLALMEHLSALTSGPQHIADLEDKTSNGKKARNAIIYHGPDTDPNAHTELPIPNEWQAVHPFVSGLVGHMVGSWNAHTDGDTLSRVIHTLADVFDEHVSTDVAKQMAIGAAGTSVPIDVPPYIGAPIAAFTGQEPKSVGEQLASNLVDKAPLWSNMTYGAGQPHKVPGQEGSDGVLLRSDSGVLKSLAGTLGAAVGVAYDLAHGFEQRAKTGDSEWAWTGLGRDYQQVWQDNTQFGNFVWNKNLPQSTFGSLEERTNGMWRNVKATMGADADIRDEGMSKARGGVPLLMTGTSPVPKDPQMRDLYLSMAQAGKNIERELMPQENNIRAQMDNLKQSPHMTEEKRRIQNKLSEELYQVYTQKHQRLLDLNAVLSTRLGGRHVDVGSPINWQGTIDQFDY